jgi:carbon storage regulator
MLVLSRKTGEQVVLPTCGVTISVVKVEGRRVRLGITAPKETAVHRMETWQRLHASQEAGHEADGNGNGRGRIAAPPQTDLNERLLRGITERTGRRIRSLRVESIGGRLVVSGHAGSYHARQLVHAAVFEVLRAQDCDRLEHVDFEIDVVP